MMPPLTPLPEPTGDVMPYPGSALILGPGRWLISTGEIVTSIRGRVVELTPNTLNYWERIAQAGQGVSLSELIV